MPLYTLYNALLTTDRALDNLRPHPAVDPARPVFRVTLAESEPCPEAWVAGPWTDYPHRAVAPTLKVWSAPAHDGRGLGLRLGYCNPGYDAFFTIHPDLTRLWVTWTAHTLSPDAAYTLVCRLLVGPVIPLVLRLRGQLALHGSVISTPVGATAFLGEAGLGKTTLAAACGRHGWPTVADDVLVLTQEAGTWWSHPGPPNRHMWPATLAALAADAELHPVVHPGTDKRHVDFADDAPGWAAFAGRPQPLAAIFALAPFDAAAPQVEIHREPPVRALQTLLRHRYGLIDTPTGLRRAEVEQCSALLGQIPVYAVVRPTRADTYRDVIDRVAQLLPDAPP